MTGKSRLELRLAGDRIDVRPAGEVAQVRDDAATAAAESP
jgi:hypothetical protein